LVAFLVSNMQWISCPLGRVRQPNAASSPRPLGDGASISENWPAARSISPCEREHFPVQCLRERVQQEWFDSPANLGGRASSKFQRDICARSPRLRDRQRLGGQQCHQLARYHRAMWLRCSVSHKHPELESEHIGGGRVQRLPWHAIRRAVI
jgi:hypothetical protein